MSHTPTHEGHVNPFSQFQPLSLSFKDDNFLNNFNDQLSNEFADLDGLGVDSGSIGGFQSRLSDQTRDRVNLNNVGNGFLEETRIGNQGSSGNGRSRSENYSYVGNLTNDSTANRNHSLLFDSRATDNDNINNLSGANNNDDSFRNSTLHKQNSFINSIRQQQNQRLSQDSFITRHLTPKQPPPQQQTYQQPTQQPPLQQPTFTNVNGNYNQSIQFDNFHGDENILEDNNEFSFNVSNPNIDIGDTEFYGSTTSQNRFNIDNGLGSIGGNYRARQNGSVNFTDTNGNQSVNEHSLMYSPATNYQEYDQDDIQDNNQYQHHHQSPQYQQPPQVEEHYNNSQYSNNNNHSAFNQNIQVEGEAKTPGTYFQDRSPNMGNLSGHGTHIEFGEPINDVDYNNNGGNNNFEEELKYGGSSLNGGVPGSADGAGIIGNNGIGLSNPNTPNGSMRMDINSSRINASNYISPIVSTNGVGAVNGRQQPDNSQSGNNTINTSYSSINIPPHASPVGYTPERGNLSTETYERLRNKFDSTIMNPRNQQPRQQTPQTPPPQQPPRQQTPPHTSVYTSTITNESQYLQHLQQQKLLELQQQRRQGQQVRSPPPRQQQPPQIYEEEEQINDNNLTIKYPMVKIEKKIDFESCEIEWVLNKDVIITNPHSKPITLSNISIYGSDRNCFKLIIPNDKLKNSTINKATSPSTTTTPLIIIIQPLSSITISIEYSPTFNNLPNFIDQFQNQANLVFTCSSTIPSHLDDFSSSEFTIHHIPSGGVFNLSIPITGSPTQQVNNSDQLIYSYNSWDMGECGSDSTSPNNTLVSNLSLKYPKGNKLIYKFDGPAEGFSFEKTSNDQISLKFQPPEKQIFNAISYVYDPNSGQKKIINLSATVNNKSSPSTQQSQLPQTQQSPTIIDPSPSTLSPSQQPKQTKSFTPNFIEEIPASSTNHQMQDSFENIDNNNYLVPLKISNYVLENGIKLIYEERKGIYPIEILPIYCNRGTENITVECISTQPDVFLIEPSTFTIKPNGIVSLQIKYQPTKHLQSQRAAIIISTPSVTKEKIKIDVVGVTLSLESTLYIPSSPPSPTYQSKKFNNIKKDNYNIGGSATNTSPTLSSSNGDGDDEYNINNTSVIFHDGDDDISRKIPSLYCNKKAIDFGGIKLGDTQSVTITLTSTLSQALHFNITFADQTGLSSNTNSSNSLFSIAGGNQLLVGSNSKTEVEIIYTPLSVAPHGTVVIFSSLNNQFQFSIPVFGYGGKSKMEIISSTRSLMDSNNTLILYVNKQTADGKSLYCNFTVKNTGQRAGFIRAFSFYPSTRSTIKPDRIILGIGESFEFRLDIQSTDNSNGLANNLLLNSTASPGKVKLFFGDELSRQRKIRSVLNRLDNLKLSDEDDYDSDFLYDYKFKDESIQDIKFKELFIAKNNNQIIQQPDGYSNQFTFDDYDDDNVELFYKQLSSLKIKPIIGNPPSSSFNQSSSNTTTTTTGTSSSSPPPSLPNNQFNLSEMDINNTPFRATTNLPYPPKSILKKQPETTSGGNNLFSTFENSKSNPSMATTTTATTNTGTGIPKVNISGSEEVYHYHIHQFENEQKVELPPIGPTSGILFFNEKKKVFGIIAPGSTFTNKILVSNASNTTLNVKLSNANYPFSLVHRTLTLNPKTTTKVPVTFSPKESSVFSQILIVESIPKVGDPVLIDRCELIGECNLSF